MGIKERLEGMLLDTDATKEILNRSKELLKSDKEPEKVAHKLAGDALSKKGDYLKALPHYENFGEVPEQIIRNNQLLYLGLVDDPEYLAIFEGLIHKYGRKFFNEDVRNKFVQKLQESPANIKKIKNLVVAIEKETGVRFDRSLIRKAYIVAIEEGYGHCVENVFANSNCEKFKPQTQEEFELINGLYERNITSNSLITPRYIHNLPIITGVSPSYKLLLKVGKEKADMVKQGKMHKDYLKEFVDSTGMPCLGKYLYERAGMKKESYKNHAASLSSVKKESILKRILCHNGR